MTKVLILVNSDLLGLGIISCIQNNIKEAKFHQENTWESTQATLLDAHFDLLIIDSYLSNLTHLSTLERIRRKHSSLKTMLLGEESHKPIMLAYLKKGVEGVCMKSISQHDFLQAYTTIMRGKKYIGNSITEYLLTDLVEDNRMGTLSARESEITNLLIRGLRTADIAGELNLAVSTVSTIKFNIYKKMQVNNVVDLACKIEISRSQK